MILSKLALRIFTLYFLAVIISAKMIEGGYYLEPITEYFIRKIKVDRILFQKKTKHQSVQCFYNQFLGKVLFLDDKIQSAAIDEYIYHESLVHPALIAHPCPEEVLVIGGGEGAVVREALKHNTVKRVTMVDIDKELVMLCQEYLPEWSDGAFQDPRTILVFEDARQFLKQTRKKFDVIISDLTEPLKQGPSVHLFTKEFFENIFKALNREGLFVLQAGSTDSFYNQFFCSLSRTLEKVFPVVRPYWACVFSFGQPWGFVSASRKYDPLALEEKEIYQRMRQRKIKKLRYYHPGFHKSYFALPLYLLKNLRKGKILTEESPFIWKI